MSDEINPYLTLGKLMEKGVDYNNIKKFIEQYLKMAQRNGEKTDDAIMQIKNFSTELHDGIMSSCVKIQAELPAASNGISTDERLTVAEAAKQYNITPATIRNWIKDKENPLPHLNVGKRQTTILLRDLHEYAKKLGKKN
jgi:excisionase family DNA binding protein